MKIRDLIVPLALAMVTTWAVQYFFLGAYQRQSGDRTEKSFIAPKVKQEYRPLNREIDFLDSKRPARAVISEVETAWGQVIFSSDGATLESIEFRRMLNGGEQRIRTIFPVAKTERESRCFLIGLQEKTPYYYTLVSRNDGDDVVTLVYKANFGEGSIRKTFTVHNNKYKIDLKLEVEPKKGLEDGLELRIFYTSPIMPEIVDSDVVSSIVIDQQDGFEKTKMSSLDEQRGWFAPSLFGTDSRYFIHALVNDADNFVQRAYYKRDGNKLLSVLEGPLVKSPTTWSLSFYFGPKSGDAVALVDQRLEKAFDYYGWFAPIAKLLIMILKWLYSHLRNYGFAIIALTFLIRLFLLPLTMRGEQRMKQQREFQKKNAYIQQRYKDDPQRVRQEKAELIRKHGMPGLGGCLLPMVVQMVIFFSLSRILSSSIELYQAPMLWIPDLSASDPYYILPILVVVAMIAQSASVADMQQRASSIAMALVFGAFATNFSSGLVIYICVSAVLAALQTRVLKYFKLMQ